ncbi:ABC transporter ATP-binding protein [Corynebacterium sp.]|uniref:ABC transporter ATP-binding protein n=1 Tax=Corynebacterium sp. TaxID=1720 RepID=UPI0026DC5EB1|nr:ABC transporter ATP-binding protein [Corynebacterium sp.]MDO5032760.1 ABC transporter ATP-binding protein [Corynebacterium sp.]
MRNEEQRPPGLRARGLSVSYGRTAPLIVDNVDVDFPAGQFSAIIGPNGCGKSTLVRALSWVEPPRSGTVMVGEEDASTLSRRRYAQRLAVMSQQATAPEGISVEGLVSRGRFAHQGFMGWRSREDERVVAEALRTVGVDQLAGAEVASLSGGQRQRVWLAMALAQDTPVLLLDEPTSALDIGYQHSFMKLMRGLVGRKTLVAVIHDLAHVLRYADYVVAMDAGRIYAAGEPQAVITPRLIKDLYGLDAEVAKVNGQWVIVPLD